MNHHPHQHHARRGGHSRRFRGRGRGRGHAHGHRRGRGGILPHAQHAPHQPQHAPHQPQRAPQFSHQQHPQPRHVSDWPQRPLAHGAESEDAIPPQPYRYQHQHQHQHQHYVAPHATQAPLSTRPPVLTPSQQHQPPLSMTADRPPRQQQSQAQPQAQPQLQTQAETAVRRPAHHALVEQHEKKKRLEDLRRQAAAHASTCLGHFTDVSSYYGNFILPSLPRPASSSS